MSSKRHVKSISRHYAVHLDAIARIYVQEHRSKAVAARRVRQELGLDTFRANRFDAWPRSPEWQSALAVAEEAVEIARRAEGNTGGQKFLSWAQTTGDKLRDRYEELGVAAAAEGADCDSEHAKLEGRILKLRDASRAEERHLAEQRVKEAMTDNRRFAEMLVRALAECQTLAEVQARLQDIALHPAAFMQEVL